MCKRKHFLKESRSHLIEEFIIKRSAWDLKRMRDKKRENIIDIRNIRRN